MARTVAADRCPGTDKFAYETRQDALSALASLKAEKHREYGRVYPCPACQRWHLTSRRRLPRPGRRR